MGHIKTGGYLPAPARHEKPLAQPVNSQDEYESDTDSATYYDTINDENHNQEHLAEVSH
jgi:hypothetical protein